MNFIKVGTEFCFTLHNELLYLNFLYLISWMIKFFYRYNLTNLSSLIIKILRTVVKSLHVNDSAYFP